MVSTALHLVFPHPTGNPECVSLDLDHGHPLERQAAYYFVIPALFPKDPRLHVNVVGYVFDDDADEACLISAARTASPPRIFNKQKGFASYPAAWSDNASAAMDCVVR